MFLTSAFALLMLVLLVDNQKPLLYNLSFLLDLGVKTLSMLQLERVMNPHYLKRQVLVVLPEFLRVTQSERFLKPRANIGLEVTTFDLLIMVMVQGLGILLLDFQ